MIMNLVTRIHRNPVLLALALLALIAMSLLLASLLTPIEGSHLLGFGYPHGSLAWGYGQ
jgi:hypothetical protein